MLTPLCSSCAGLRVNLPRGTWRSKTTTVKNYSKFLNFKASIN